MPFSLRKVTPSHSKTATTHTKFLDIQSHIGSAFMRVVTAESLRGKWLTASCLREMIKQRYAFRDASDFTPQTLTKAINKVLMSSKRRETVSRATCSSFPTLREWRRSFLREASHTDQQLTLIRPLLIGYYWKRSEYARIRATTLLRESQEI